VIILGTHMWVWWVHRDEHLTIPQTAIIEANETDMIEVSAISVWEIAKLDEYNRLALPCPVPDWFEEALRNPGIRLVELTPEFAIESCKLPGDFHRDPADQIIVATARMYDCPLVTSDSRIQKYPYVRTVAYGTNPGSGGFGHNPQRPSGYGGNQWRPLRSCDANHQCLVPFQSVPATGGTVDE